MSTRPPRANQLSSLRDLLAEIQERRGRIGHHKAELDVLTRQLTTEAEKLQQRSEQIDAKLKRLQEDLESYTKQEIQDFHLTAKEAEMKAFMLQGQMDVLRQKRASIEELDHELARLQEFASGMERSQQHPAVPPPPPEVAARPAESEEVALAVVEAREDERRRVSRRIHDGPAQSLSNLVLRAEICERVLGPDPEQAKRELAHLKSLVSETLRDTRRLIFDLRPMILDDLGLIPTVRRYLEGLTRGTGLEVELRIDGKERRLPSGIELALFRAIQEALENVREHSEARAAQVSIELDDEYASVAVSDKGQGFEVEPTLERAKQKKGVGLGSLLERIRLLSGEVQVKSSPGAGTVLSVRVPVPPASERAETGDSRG